MRELIDLEGFLKIFTFDKKRDLEKYCREVTTYGRDFAAFILSCKAGSMPFLHRAYHRDHVPEHLIPSDTEHDALSKNGVGTLRGDAKKMVRKMAQLFRQRRHLSGHIFYTPNLEEWHFFYFDQRDTEEDRPNHWEGGSHIHFINWLWPQYTAQNLWAQFISGEKKLNGALHIRHLDEKKE